MSVFQDTCLFCETPLLVPNSTYCTDKCRRRDVRVDSLSSVESATSSTGSVVEDLSWSSYFYTAARHPPSTNLTSVPVSMSLSSSSISSANTSSSSQHRYLQPRDWTASANIPKKAIIPSNDISSPIPPRTSSRHHSSSGTSQR